MRNSINSYLLIILCIFFFSIFLTCSFFKYTGVYEFHLFYYPPESGKLPEDHDWQYSGSVYYEHLRSDPNTCDITISVEDVNDNNVLTDKIQLSAENIQDCEIWNVFDTLIINYMDIPHSVICTDTGLPSPFYSNTYVYQPQSNTFAKQ